MRLSCVIYMLAHATYAAKVFDKATNCPTTWRMSNIFHTHREQERKTKKEIHFAHTQIGRNKFTFKKFLYLICISNCRHKY